MNNIYGYIYVHRMERLMSQTLQESPHSLKQWILSQSVDTIIEALIIGKNAIENKVDYRGIVQECLNQYEQQGNEDVIHTIKQSLEYADERNRTRAEILQSSIQELMTTKSISSKKGAIVEKELLDILTAEYPGWKWTNSSKKKASGDIQFITSNNVFGLIESKDYSNVVPKKELDKFYRDIDASSPQVAIFCSKNSSVSGMKEQFICEKKGRTMVFIINQWMNYSEQWSIILRMIQTMTTSTGNLNSEHLHSVIQQWIDEIQDLKEIQDDLFDIMTNTQQKILGVNQKLAKKQQNLLNGLEQCKCQLDE